MTESTHAVTNQFDELVDYNLFATDIALRDALARAGADWGVPQLDAYGARLGSADTARLADEANRHTPELHTFDRRGRRVDRVDFHPAWHTLLGQYRHEGFVSLAFRDTRRGRWAATAAGFYLHGQIEAGTLCPATMTQAAIPVLQKERAVGLAARQALQQRLRSARRAGRRQAFDLVRHGHDRETGRLRRAREHDACDRRRRGRPRRRIPAARPQVVFLGADVRRAPRRRAHRSRQPVVLLRAALAAGRHEERGRDPAAEGQGRQPQQLEQRDRAERRVGHHARRRRPRHSDHHRDGHHHAAELRARQRGDAASGRRAGDRVRASAMRSAARSPSSR